MEKRIVTEDIFSKAARNLCERLGECPTESLSYNLREELYRQELELLAEKILALKDVGAI